jgi:ABC-type phosphate transport system auxiliary subunit
MPAKSKTYAQITALLEEGSEEAGRSAERLEDTLTAGYAIALALEAERLRIERRIAEVAGKLGDHESELRAKELGGLSERLAKADNELVRLRTALVTLKDQARAARRAEAAA